MVSHYLFGAAGGPPALALMSMGMSPIKAANAVAASMEVFVDRAANTVLGLTAPFWQFPIIANVRGVAAHGVYGACLGLILEAGAAR